MVKPEVIRKRLNKLDDYLSILKQIKKYTRQEFIVDPKKISNIEFRSKKSIYQIMILHFIKTWFLVPLTYGKSNKNI